MASFVGSFHIDYLDVPIDVSYLHLGIDGLAGGSFLLDYAAIGLKHSHSQLIFSISIDTHEGQNCQNLIILKLPMKTIDPMTTPMIRPFLSSDYC